MKKLDTLVYEALSSIDPVEEIENLTGKSVDDLSQDEQLSMLRMAFMQNKAKDKMLSQAGDTTFSMGMGDYIRVVESLGFEKALEIPLYGEDEGDTHYVYGHRQFGFVLDVDSFTWDKSAANSRVSRNRADLYFCWQSATGRSPGGSGGWESSEQPMWQHERAYGEGLPADAFWYGHDDVREGLLYRINSMLDTGTFYTAWPKMRKCFIQAFTVRSDYKKYDYWRREVYDALAIQRFAQAPDWFKAILNGNLDYLNEQG